MQHQYIVCFISELKCHPEHSLFSSYWDTKLTSLSTLGRTKSEECTSWWANLSSKFCSRQRLTGLLCLSKKSQASLPLATERTGEALLLSFPVSLAHNEMLLSCLWELVYEILYCPVKLSTLPFKTEGCSLRWMECFVYQLFQESWSLNTALTQLALGSFSHCWGGERNVGVTAQPCSRCILQKNPNSWVISSSFLLQASAVPSYFTQEGEGRQVAFSVLQAMSNSLLHKIQVASVCPCFMGKINDN